MYSGTIDHAGWNRSQRLGHQGYAGQSCKSLNCSSSRKWFWFLTLLKNKVCQRGSLKIRTISVRILPRWPHSFKCGQTKGRLYNFCLKVLYVIRLQLRLYSQTQCILTQAYNLLRQFDPTFEEFKVLYALKAYWQLHATIVCYDSCYDTSMQFTNRVFKKV